jgi:hypothetical protein
VLFTLVSKVRPGDSVYLGASPKTSYVLAVSPAADNKVRIVTDAGSALLGPAQRIRIG